MVRVVTRKTSPLFNVALGLVLSSFVGGVYYYTMHRMAVVRARAAAQRTPRSSPQPLRPRAHCPLPAPLPACRTSS
jgi:hypothetical protein